MKSRILVAAVVMSAIVVGYTFGAATQKAPGKDVKCPVTGKSVNPDAKVEFNGGTVYFCCEKCPKAFNSDKQKYAAKANHQLVQTGQLVEFACPLTGRPLNPATAINVEGVNVAFCCNNCKGKAVKLTGDEQVKLIFSNTSKGYKPAAASAN